MSPDILIYVFIFVLGSIVGSFLNVCIYRMPREKSIVFPGSQCVHCAAPIRWHDNIPFVSFLLLLGKCRNCGKPISIRYFIVEALSAVMAVSLYAAFGLSVKFGVYCVLAAGLIVATFIDFDYQIIPDSISVGGTVLGLAASTAFPALMGTADRLTALGLSLLGAAVGGGAIWITGFLGERAFKKPAMGGGDVKLMAALGAFLGWKLVLFIFFVAPFFGSVIGIIEKIKYKRETVPYGPYLSLAAIIAIFWGERILRCLFLY